MWVERKTKPGSKSQQQQREDIKNVSKKIKTSQSGQKKGVKKVNKKDDGLNCIGYPHDDPYGLVAAWWKIFTKPKEKNVTGKKTETIIKHSGKDFY